MMLRHQEISTRSEKKLKHHSYHVDFWLAFDANQRFQGSRSHGKETIWKYYLISNFTKTITLTQNNLVLNLFYPIGLFSTYRKCLPEVKNFFSFVFKIKMQHLHRSNKVWTSSKRSN